MHIGNTISGLDFSPTGDLVATIDRYGTCLISDVGTASYQLHLDMGGERDSNNHSVPPEILLISNSF